MNRFMDEDAAVPYDPDDQTKAGSHALKIKQKYEQELLAIDGVEGIGLGFDQLGNDAVVLYLHDAAARRHLPEMLEDTPVITEITGPIDAS